MRLSFTVKEENSCAIWKVLRIPRLNSWWGSWPVILILSNVISPASGLIDPLITLNKVVLPAPLGPINAVIDPCYTLIETLLMAWMPPKLLYRFLILSILDLIK